MDGNGRWAKQRGLPRTAGHEQGEHSLFDVVEGAIEIGVKAISAYAFSTENWSRSPDEVRFLMGFNRDVIRRRRDEMHELGVRVRWAGRAPRLWKSVIRELQVAEELTQRQRRADADDVRQLRRPRRARRRRPGDRPRGGRRAAGPGQGRREDLRPAPLRPRAARRRPGLAHVGGAAAVQLHAVAGGVLRDGLHRRALARRRPPPPVARHRHLRPARPALRRGRPERPRPPRPGREPGSTLECRSSRGRPQEVS